MFNKRQYHSIGGAWDLRPDINALRSGRRLMVCERARRGTRPDLLRLECHPQADGGAEGHADLEDLDAVHKLVKALLAEETGDGREHGTRKKDASGEGEANGRRTGDGE